MKIIASLILMTLLTITSSRVAACQDEIAYANGESVRGKVLAVNSSYVKIKTNGGIKQKLSAEQVSYVRHNEFYYYSRKIDVPTTHGLLRQHQFLRLAVLGRINTYTFTQYMGRSGYVNHYAQKGDSNIVYIGTTGGLVPSPQLTPSVTANISALLSDNPSLRMRYDAELNKEKLRVINRYVKEYNETVTGDQ